MERLQKAGSVKLYSSSEISHSRVGMGFEKLDRDVFDPENAYDFVAAAGVKWIRIQSGWERTEQVRGEYSFEWLDQIVENLLRRGLQPWMCLCYGNPLYTELAKEHFGSVGCVPLFSEEERQGWQNYVRACVSRYRGRIDHFEVWNEPDGRWCWKHGVSGREYGEFVVLTAEAVREVAPEAKIIAGVQCNMDFDWTADMLAAGAGKVMDAYCYHNYSADENSKNEFLAAVKSLCRSYNPKMEFIQGETGCQSRRGGKGALHTGAWTERRQMKFMARHFMSDFGQDVKFASWFSSLDMVEALNGRRGDLASYLDYGYFGVLRAEFDENGRGTGVYTPKPAYQTLRVISSLFREDFTVEQLPVYLGKGGASPLMLHDEDDGQDICQVGFRKPNGSAAFAYWKSTDLMTTEYEGTISFMSGILSDDVRLIDLLDGTIYRLPPEMMQRTGSVIRFEQIPLKDTPLLLTFGDFA